MRALFHVACGAVIQLILSKPILVARYTDNDDGICFLPNEVDNNYLNRFVTASEILSYERVIRVESSSPLGWDCDLPHVQNRHSYFLSAYSSAKVIFLAGSVSTNGTSITAMLTGSLIKQKSVKRLYEFGADRLHPTPAGTANDVAVLIRAFVFGLCDIAIIAANFSFGGEKCAQCCVNAP